MHGSLAKWFAILAVDGWMTTMALFGCIATALRAAFSACWVIVVARSAMFCGATTTAWLFAKGAWLEQDFKRFQRHHQIPTDVWYKAYPGLTAQDLARNSRIRNGFEKTTMSDDEIRRWVAEI